MHSKASANWFGRKILRATLNEKSWNFELGNGCPNCGWATTNVNCTPKNHNIAKIN
jgi:hypothetical protein